MTSSSFSKKGFGGFVSKVTILYIYYYLYIKKMIYKFSVLYILVCMGLEKSLKKYHVLEKSLNFPQKSLMNIFKTSLNKNDFC